jgi:type IX secretion system PorP/SprF family membrane protein
MRKTFIPGIILLAVLLTGTVRLRAQDYHLSQFDLAPLYINPATTGIYFGEKGDFRLMADYRSQWQKLQSKPYTTSSVAFDMPLSKRFGVGGYVIDNLAGVSNYNTLGFMVGTAYRITSPESKYHFLSVGMQVGLMERNYANDLLFSTQYSSSQGLDATLPTDENLQKLSMLKFDANIGIYYKYKNEFKQFNPFGGFSIDHITRPDQGTGGVPYRLPMRFNLSGGTDIYINKLINLQPIALFMYQGGATEFNIGMMEYYHVNTNYQLISGISYRFQDALILQVGIKQGGSTFRMSYDVITSPLKAYAGVRGAIEMGVIYTGNKK